MMPINESSMGLLADEAAKAIYKTKRTPKYKKKMDVYKIARNGKYTLGYEAIPKSRRLIGSRGESHD